MNSILGDKPTFGVIVNIQFLMQCLEPRFRELALALWTLAHIYWRPAWLGLIIDKKYN